jgi:hypothetical protein
VTRVIIRLFAERAGNRVCGSPVHVLALAGFGGTMPPSADAENRAVIRNSSPT